MSTSASNFEELKCIWMASNVVEYKLCDYNFDCDNCVFDRAIRNKSLQQQESNYFVKYQKSSAAEIIRSIEQLSFEKEFNVTTNLLSARSIFNSTHYLGLSMLLQNLLDPDTIVIDRCERGSLKKDDPLLELRGSWGKMLFRSPFDLLMLSPTKSVKKRSISDSWHYMIEVNSDTITPSLLSRETYHTKITDVLSELRQIENERLMVGQTLNDGGILERKISAILGKKRFLELLHHLTGR